MDLILGLRVEGETCSLKLQLIKTSTVHIPLWSPLQWTELCRAVVRLGSPCAVSQGLLSPLPCPSGSMALEY